MVGCLSLSCKCSDNAMLDLLYVIDQWNVTHWTSCILTHYGLAMLYDNIDLGQHCLTVLSHYLNQCWLISEVLWHSHEGNFIGNSQIVIFELISRINILDMSLKMTIFKVTATSHRGQWFKVLHFILFYFVCSDPRRQMNRKSTTTLMVVEIVYNPKHCCRCLVPSSTRSSANSLSILS